MRLNNNLKGVVVTYMWKEERGKPYYRFQTDENEIRNKIKRRQKFVLTGWGVNCNLWIYQAKFSRPDIAKKVFETLIGEKAIFNSKEEIFIPMSNLSNPEKSAA